MARDSVSSHKAQPAAKAGRYRLGGATVARMGFGAMQLRRLAGEPAKAAALLEQAIQLGVDHIDTAHFYGDGFVNQAIGEVLRSHDIVVASKVGAAPNPGGAIPIQAAQRPEQLRASVEDNLRSLGIDQISLVNLRRMDAGPGLKAEGDQIVDLDDQLAVMIALRAEGKIGSIGLSNVDLHQLEHSLPANIACVQNAYSLMSRQFESMLELCREREIAWVPYFPLGGAFPTWPKVATQPVVIEIAARLSITPSQLGLAWLLDHAPNTLLIPGTADSDHLVENIAAAAVRLDSEAREALDALEPPAAEEAPLQ